MVRLAQILLRRGKQIVKGEDPESYRHIKHGPVKWRDYRSAFVEPPYWYKWSLQSPYSPIEQQRIRARQDAGWYAFNYDKIGYTPPEQWLYRVGDKVAVLTGKDKGKKGEVVKIVPERNWVVVGGMNLKYVEANGEVTTEEEPLEHNEVSLLDPSDNNPTDVELKADENGNLVRVSIRTGRIVQEPLELLHNRTPKCEYIDQDKDTSEKNALTRTFVPSMKCPEEELEGIFKVKDSPKRETFWY